MKSILSTCVFFLCCAAVLAGNESQAALKDVLGRLDQASKTFHASSANVRWTKHTAVLNDDDTQTGIALQAKTARGFLGRIDITAPDKKTYTFEGRTVQMFYPNAKEVQIIDVGAQGEQVSQFLMLGFGTSGAELERAYSVQLVGEENVGGERAAHLALVPKSERARELVKQVDLWLSDKGSYPVQEKILEKSGDYNLIAFSGVQLNPPQLKENDLKLVLPAGVKKVYPQK